VVSRCQRYDLRRLTAPEITGRLREISRAEGIEISDRSLATVARESDGSLRDALTLLDQLVASGTGGAVDDALVARVLDLTDRKLLLGIVEALVDGDAGRTLEACARAAVAGIEAKRLSGEILQCLRDLVVLSVAPSTPGLVEASDAELEELRGLTKRTEEVRLRRMFRALLKEQEDLAWAPQPFAVLEMALVRLATLPRGDDVAALLSRLEALERELSQGSPPSSGTGGASGARRSGAGTRAPGSPGTKRGAAPREDAPEASPPEEEGVEEIPEDPPRDLPPPEEGAPLEVVFDRLRGLAKTENRALFAALEGGKILERTSESLRIGVPEGFAAARLEARREGMEALCARLFGRPVAVRIEPLAQRAPAAKAASTIDPEVLRQRRQAALNHPSVNIAMEVLGGEIVDIRPVGGGR
jgi:DNA polymerase-3 subunit gamma/tau